MQEEGRKIRVGAVNYLNTRPLVHNLPTLAQGIDLVFDLPSRLADELAAGRLDVALIPSIEYLRNPQYRIVSDACIACRGPVLSVKLFSRVPVSQIRSLALDEGSRTSATLLRILLAERYSIHPELLPLPIGQGLGETSADAVLLIGDRAIHSPAEKFEAIWDLGDEWCQWTGLPFVFAMWTARSGPREESRTARSGLQAESRTAGSGADSREGQLASLAAALSSARDAGVAALDQIAGREAPGLGLTVPQCLSYLRDNLYFYLGERELRGLETFRERAAQLRLVDGVEGASAAETIVANRDASKHRPSGPSTIQATAG